MNSTSAEDIFVSIAQAAEALGTTPVNVLLLIKRGQLAGSEGDEGWLVDRESLAAFRNSEAGELGRAVCRSACSRAGHCGGCD